MLKIAHKGPGGARRDVIRAVIAGPIREDRNRVAGATVMGLCNRPATAVAKGRGTTARGGRRADGKACAARE